jgi:hypothetical protein
MLSPMLLDLMPHQWPGWSQEPNGNTRSPLLLIVYSTQTQRLNPHWERGKGQFLSKGMIRWCKRHGVQLCRTWNVENS